jgi:hypothetical protein
VHDILHKWEIKLDDYVARDEALDTLLEVQSDLQEVAKLGDDARDRDGDPISPAAYKAKLTYFEHRKYDYMFFAKFSYESMLRVGVRELFMALLQQYDLAPQARKKIEQYSKFYAKSKARNPKDFGAAIELFKELLETYREQYITTKHIATTAKLRGTDVDGVKVLDAGPFKAVNTGGFDQATMDKVARVIEEAARRLQARGLGKVCYGDILVSKNIHKSKTLAFYLIAKDEMFIRADLKGHEKAALSTVLHELGHRLRFKFLESKRMDIARMYTKIKLGQDALEQQAIDEAMQDPNLKPKPGDTFVDGKKRNFVVDKLNYTGRSLVVDLYLAEDEKRKFRVPLKSYLALKGVKPNVAKATGFVTLYAGKDEEENFAEMIAHYCLNELPDEQIAMLLPIIS